MDFYFNSAHITNPVEGSVSSGLFTAFDTTSDPGVLIDNDFRLNTNFAGSIVKGVRFAAQSFRPTYFSEISGLFSSIGDRFSNLGVAGSGRTDYLIVNRADISNNPNMEVWVSQDSISSYTKIFDGAIESGNQFSINSLTGLSGKWFVIQFKGTYDIDVSEFILAEGILNLIQQDNYTQRGVPNIKHRGNRSGDEVTNKIDEMKQIVLLNWELIEQSDADKILALVDGVFNNAQQFVNVNGSDRNWDRLAVKPVLIDKGYKAYSTQLDLLRSFT